MGRVKTRYFILALVGFHFFFLTTRLDRLPWLTTPGYVLVWLGMAVIGWFCIHSAIQWNTESFARKVLDEVNEDLKLYPSSRGFRLKDD